MDLPTEGNPIRPTLESPDLETSKPSPVPMEMLREWNRGNETSSFFSAGSFDKFALEFGQFSLKHANMKAGSLVFLSFVHFIFDFGNFLGQRHGNCKKQKGKKILEKYNEL